VITPAEVHDVVNSTTRNAEKYYSNGHRSLTSLRQSLSVWSDPTYASRQKALPTLANLTQFSKANIICYGLTPLAYMNFTSGQQAQLPQHLCQLIETGQHQKFTQWGQGYLKGYGTPKITTYPKPKRILQILAGNVIGPSWLSTSLGVLLQGPQIIKLPYRDLASFMYYLQSLADIDPGLRSTIACGYYPSDNGVNDILLKQADAVIAMGSDDTMEAIRRKLAEINPQARFIPHGLKLSFQVIGKAYATPEVAGLAAWGAVAYDGNGCFSPGNVYVERGGPLSPQQFAETLAEKMDSISKVIPPKRTMAAAERVMNYRLSQMQRRLLGEDVTVMKSASTDYTVIVDNEDPTLTPTCQERVVMVRPIDEIRDVPRYVEHLSGNLQTVGLAVPTEDLLEMADRLGTAGVTNLKMVGTEYTLDLSEPHDGIFDTVQLVMSDGLRWVNLSFSDTDRAIEDALMIEESSLAALQCQKEFP